MKNHSSTLNILAVDDQKTDLDFLGWAIAHVNPDVRLFTVCNGREAIDYLEGNGAYADRSAHPLPDSIILDLKMWRMDGFQFLEWRKSSRYTALPVAVLTDSPDEDELQRALDLGANVAFTKPNRLSEITGVARTIVDFGMKHRVSEEAGSQVGKT